MLSSQSVNGPAVVLGGLPCILIAPTSSFQPHEQHEVEGGLLQSALFSLLCVDARLSGAKSTNGMIIHRRLDSGQILPRLFIGTLTVAFINLLEVPSVLTCFRARRMVN